MAVAAVALAATVGIHALDVRRTSQASAPRPRPSVAPLAAAAELGAAASPPVPNPLPPASAPAQSLDAPARGEPSAPSTDRRVARAEPVPVELLVRPYGSVAVDGGPKSRDPLAAHALLLVPGRHSIRVSCEWCEDAEHSIDVLPGGPQTFALPARLKTAYLKFDFEPKDATVTVAGEQRTSEQSLSHPFALLSPHAATRFIHQVAYVVSRPGYRDARGTLEVLPGKSETVSGKLEPR